jgi:hypothetical protein
MLDGVLSLRSIYGRELNSRGWNWNASCCYSTYAAGIIPKDKGRELFRAESWHETIRLSSLRYPGHSPICIGNVVNPTLAALVSHHGSMIPSI